MRNDRGEIPFAMYSWPTFRVSDLLGAYRSAGGQRRDCKPAACCGHNLRGCAAGCAAHHRRMQPWSTMSWECTCTMSWEYTCHHRTCPECLNQMSPAHRIQSSAFRAFVFRMRGSMDWLPASKPLLVATDAPLTTSYACSTAAQRSQQDRARAQLMAEEAADAWQVAFPGEDAKQQIGGSDAAWSRNHPLPDFVADIDDALLVSNQISLMVGCGRVTWQALGAIFAGAVALN